MDNLKHIKKIHADYVAYIKETYGQGKKKGFNQKLIKASTKGANNNSNLNK